MARALVIAYTTYIHDGRVKRHAEALAHRGDQVDAITLAAGKTGLINGVNVIGLEIPRYRGSEPYFIPEKLCQLLRAGVA